MARRVTIENNKSANFQMVLPGPLRMAIRLMSLKTGKLYGEIVEAAIRQMYPKDVAEAEAIVASQTKGAKE